MSRNHYCKGPAAITSTSISRLELELPTSLTLKDPNYNDKPRDANGAARDGFLFSSALPQLETLWLNLTSTVYDSDVEVDEDDERDGEVGEVWEVEFFNQYTYNG